MVVLLRAREIALRTREIRQNCRFSLVRRAISRAREQHVAEFRVACCMCPAKEPPKTVMIFFGETIERAALVSTLRIGLSFR